MILLDTSGLLTWLDERQRLHRRVAEVMRGYEGPYLLSSFVLAEFDYLLATRVGQSAQHSLLKEVHRGVFRLEVFSPEEIGRALEIMEQYADLSIGLADASIVVLAERTDCAAVLTLDERHFRVLTHRGLPFWLIPSDA